jgi:hypothetical protein
MHLKDAVSQLHCRPRIAFSRMPNVRLHRVLRPFPTCSANKTTVSRPDLTLPTAARTFYHPVLQLLAAPSRASVAIGLIRPHFPTRYSLGQGPTAVTMRDLLGRMPRRDFDPLFVSDAGYDPARLLA